MTLVFVAILWLLIIVGVGLDAWEVREQARADARRRASWWEVSCGCPGCAPRVWKGERMTLDVPITDASRAVWNALRESVGMTRQQRRKAERHGKRARMFRSARRALRKRWQVKKLLPVRHPKWMREMFR